MSDSVQPNQQPPKAPKKKRPWWRRLLKWFAVLLLIICLLPVGLLVGWQVSFIRKPLVQFGVGFAKVALDGKVEVADLKGDLLTHIILEKVRWRDRKGRTMATLESLEAHYDLMHFLSKGELLVTKVVIKRPAGAMGPRLYGVSPKPGGGVLIAEVDPAKRAEARKKYALVTEIIDLLAHITPTLPKFCKQDASCGPKASCQPFSHKPPAKYSAWKGVCKDKPKPKKKPETGGFKMRLPKISIENADFDWVMGPKARLSYKGFSAKASFALEGSNIKAKLRDARVQSMMPDIKVRRLDTDFSLKGDDMRAKNLVLLFNKRGEIRLDAQLNLAKVLGVKAKLKKIFVTADDMKPIVPAWPIKPNIELTGDVDGSLADITAKINGSIGQGKLALDARSGVLSQSYDVKVGLTKIDLSELLGNPQLKSMINVKVTAKGKGFSDATDGKVTVDVTPGYFQKFGYKYVKVRVSLKDRLAKIKKLLVSTPFADVDVSGRAHLLTGKFFIKAGVQVAKLRRIGRLIKQRMRGSVIVKAKLYGDKWMPIRPSTARITIRRFWHPAASLRNATIKADVFGLQPKIKARVAIDADGIKAGGRRFRYLMLTLGYEMDGPLQKVLLSRLRFNMGSGRYQLEKRAWVNRRRTTLTTRLSFDTKRMIARVSRLWLRRRSERIRVDGWIDLKRWRQDLTVSIKKLDLAALRRALGIMPKSKLAGKVNVDVGFAGSFYRPQVSVDVKLRNARFQKFKQIKTDLRLRYAAGAVRRKQRLLLDVDVAMGQTKLVRLRSSLPVGIALRGSLRPPLVLGNPAIRVDLDAPLSFDLTVPDIVLDRLQQHIGQPVKGRFNLHLMLSQRLRNPRLSLALRADDISWEQRRKVKVKVRVRRGKGKKGSVVNVKFGNKNKVNSRMRSQVQYKTKRVSAFKISNLGARFLINYQKGRLFFEPSANWLRHKRDTLMTLAGRVPLAVSFFRLRRRRRNQPSLGVSYRLMRNKPINFRIQFPERRLKRLFTLLPVSLRKTLGHMRGRFGGHLALRGLPYHPRVDLSLRLKKASLCPLEKGRFRCKKVSLSTTRKKRVENLRIYGVDFALGVLYEPPPKQTIKVSRRSIAFGKSGNLQLSSKLSVRKYTLFEIAKRVKLGGSEVPTGIPLAFALHPRTFKPFFRLFTEQPTRFQLNIPNTNISSGDTFCGGSHKGRRRGGPSLVDFVRLPILRRLRGQISLEVALRKKLSNPLAKLLFRFRRGGYLYGCNNAGKPLWIDGVSAAVKVALNKGFATASVRTDVMKSPLLRSDVQLMTKAGLTTGVDPKTRKVSYKPLFVLGKKIFARVLICRFRLQRFAKLGGIFKKLSGTLQGQIQLKGDPACPVLHTESAPSGRLRFRNPCEGIEKSSHIQLSNLVLGPRRRRRRKLLRKRKRKPRLEISKFRIDLASIARGRTSVKVVSTQKRCFRYKFHVRSAADRVKLKQRIARSRRQCPREKVESPRGRRRYWWLYRKNKMFTLNVEAPLPLRFLSLKPKEVSKRCPHWGGPKPSQALLLAFKSHGINLNFVESFVPGLTMNAYFGGNVQIRGDGKSPPVIQQSQISLDLKRIKYPAFGVEILTRSVREPSKIWLRFGQKFLRLSGSLYGTQGTPLTIKGEIRHKSFVPQYYNIRVKAGDFRPMNTQKYQLSMKTDIKIWKKPKSLGSSDSPPIFVRGGIEIPKFLFTLPEGSTSPSTYKEDGDIIVLGEPSERRLRLERNNNAERPPSSSGGGLNLDLKIVIPGNFKIRNRDLQIEARTPQDNPLRVKMYENFIVLAGAIEIVRGEVGYLGKRFSVKPGSGVSFSGQSIPLSDIGSRIDPKIDVTAVYKFKAPKGSSLDRKGHKKVDINLIARGSLQTLNQKSIIFQVVDAFSNQDVNLDKVNILSLILTGTTTDDLSAGQQKNIAGQAFGMLGSALASELRNQLSGVLKVDVLNIDTGTSAQDLKVEAGWYLTPDIYFQIAGKPAPLDEENYWETLFDYSITRKWSLELRFGQIKRNLSQPIRASGQVFYRLKY